MSTEAPEAPPKSGNPFVIFAISLCAAIVMAGGFAIVVEAFIIAAANLFELGVIFLGATFVQLASIVNALAAAWFAIWTFVRCWHVERRLRSGLEVDEPEMSILAMMRG